jgi:MarR family transcriptional regulator, 2-MHQ and catechol-resistance regulon repressor
MHNYMQARRRRGKGKGNARASSLTQDASALYQVMTELLRAYQFRDRDRLGYHGLTITQSYVLHILIQRGPLTLNELAAEMHLDKSTLSRMVDGLEGKQAVRRTANPADDRSTLIEATRSGTQRHERVEADIVAENAKLLSAFTAPTRRQLLVLIQLLTQAVRQRRLEPAD